MPRRGYPSDVSDDERTFVAPHLTLMREDAPQRTHPPRGLFGGLRYTVRTGCQRRHLPADVPPWEAVYQRARRWMRAGAFDAGGPRVLPRPPADRREDPTAARIDGRTIQGTPDGGPRGGRDGHERKKGSKLHLAVDMPGRLPALVVTPADVGDREAVAGPAAGVRDATGARVGVASVVQGCAPAGDAAATGIDLVVVGLPRAERGFVLLPRRWAAGRGWASPGRRGSAGSRGTTSGWRPRRPTCTSWRSPRSCCGSHALDGVPECITRSRTAELDSWRVATVPEVARGIARCDRAEHALHRGPQRLDRPRSQGSQRPHHLRERPLDRTRARRVRRQEPQPGARRPDQPTRPMDPCGCRSCPGPRRRPRPASGTAPASAFLRVMPARRNARQIAVRLATTPSRLRSSVGVASGCSRTGPAMRDRSNARGRRTPRERGLVSPVSRRRCLSRRTQARPTSNRSATRLVGCPASHAVSARSRSSCG